MNSKSSGLYKQNNSNISSSKLKIKLNICRVLGYISFALFVIFAGLVIYFSILLFGCKGSECSGGILVAFMIWPLVIFFFLAAFLLGKAKKIEKSIK